MKLVNQNQARRYALKKLLGGGTTDVRQLAYISYLVKFIRMRQQLGP